MINRLKGEIVKGHFCSRCLPYVDKCPVDKSNPSVTRRCIKCDHNADGRTSTALVGDWLILGKSS